MSTYEKLRIDDLKRFDDAKVFELEKSQKILDSRDTANRG